ncbi:MOSC domain-containing protein [Devosia chinhatensis]|uniref:MOSC domain-containing protein n=1 Tax=Devosia chinhatensis TaxID=429727 RepID=A0A0F5FFN0_9HYPH|nr:MOSC domain-containing protein [Devosia chinhatensis]KKB07699.1 hypothetical protein VE26_13565 [Devosia chinhatensis]
MSMVRLDSVNRGTPQPVPGRTTRSGIYKRPVTGPVEIAPLGLVDDAVLNRKHHGGVDQAVYLYFADDYAFWGEEGVDVTPGLFGENLTISGVVGRDVAVGDRFGIGTVLLEVTSHRTPCAVFAARMGDPRFAKRFHKAGRPGAYCRVLAGGAVEAGMAVDLTPFSGARITMSALIALDGARSIDADFLRRALTAPLHHKMRADYENRLASQLL